MNGKEANELLKKKEAVIEDIRKKYPSINFPEPILEPIFYGRLDKNIIQNRKLILDKKEGTQFDIVSDKYELVHHEEVLYKFLNAIPEEFGEPKLKTSIFKYGARALFEMEFPDIKDFNIKGSPVHPMYRLKNSYDRSSHLSYSAGAMEQVCTNGMMAFKSKDNQSAKHIGSTVSSFDLENKMRSSMKNISDTHKMWLAWAEKKLNEAQIQTVIEKLPYSEKEQEALLSLPLKNHDGKTIKEIGTNTTLWTINSAATQMVHELASEERRYTIEENVPDILLREFFDLSHAA